MAGKRIGLAERRSQEARRPVEALFGADPVGGHSGEAAPERKVKRTLIRQTYHMDPVIIEAVRIMEFESREGISTMVNRILREYIPDDVIQKAEASLKKRNGQKLF